MKLTLAPLASALGLSLLMFGVGCGAGTVQTGAVASMPSASSEVGTTSLSSASLGPSKLAPAAWESDEQEPAAAAPIAPTWGAPEARAAVGATPATPAP
jgi:hypothetical protein